MTTQPPSIKLFRQTEPDVADCPACRMVFCTKCSLSYHGKAVECLTGIEEAGEEKEEEEPAALSKDMVFFQKMLVKKGAGHCHQELNRWIDGMFGHVRGKEKAEMNRKYRKSPQEREAWNEAYGRAVMEYYFSRVGSYKTRPDTYERTTYRTA